MTQLRTLNPRRHPVAARKNTSAQSVATSTFTPMVLSTTIGLWTGPGSVKYVDLASTGSLLMKAGVCHVNGMVGFANTGGNRRQAVIEVKTTVDGTFVNANNPDRVEYVPTTNGWCGIARGTYDNVGDNYARLIAWQSTGAALNVTGNPPPSLAAERLDCWNYVP